MAIKNMSILNALVESGKINTETANAVEAAVAESGEGIEAVLGKRGIGAKDILDVKGSYYNIPTKDLEGATIPPDILELIPEKSVQHYSIVPVGFEDGVLHVGVVDPGNIEVRDAVQFITSKSGTPFKLFAITESDFERISSSYKGLSGEVSEALSELETELSADEVELSKDVKDVDAPKKSTMIIEDAPVTKIVATVLRYATEGNASDIHIEHTGEQIRVRFRVDGELHTSLILPVQVHSAVVARIKILSNMKLDERRKPQDGRFSAHIEGRKIDFRTSTFPAYYGEKVVMRILDQTKGIIKLEEMGFNSNHYSLITDAIKRPYGLILISGPTGSGKTTTLYSMLNEIDKERKNVLSLEDPVEYNIPGMSQSQVRPEIGYTFANGLRTALRQDPDIIMVGEIRDKETAQLAVQAALTGHLVFSTIHTNTAIGAIPRLVDMGVDPYLIAPTLILAIAQRLVRKLCPDGGETMPIEGSIQMLIDKQFNDLPEAFKQTLNLKDEVYKAVPSSECPSGTKGRLAVFEVLPIDNDIEKIILTNPVEDEIMKAARQKGMITMKEDAIIRSMHREIPFEEVGKL